MNAAEKTAIAIVSLSLLIPSLVWAANGVQIANAVTFALQTADTASATTILASSGGQVTSLAVGTNAIDITIDNASTVTFTTTGGQFLRISTVSGSGAYTLSPTCPATSATITGTGAQTVVELGVYTTNNCPAIIGNGGGGGGGGGTNYSPYSPPTATPTQPVDTMQTELNLRLANLQALGLAVQNLVKLPDDGNPATQDDTAVYYVGADGRRHAFPNTKVYNTWYCDFSLVQVVSLQTMAALPLGQSIAYRPGFKMIKFTGPTVYAVDADRTLRPLASQTIAEQLYGSEWNKQIDDVSDVFFLDYTFGEPISDPSQFTPQAQINGVSTPSSVLSIPGYSEPGTDFGCKEVMPPITHEIIKGIPATFRFTNDLATNSSDVVGVRYLQIFLKSQGAAIYPEGLVTGNFGPATMAAVKRFQGAHGIVETGVAAYTTRQEINAILTAAKS